MPLQGVREGSIPSRSTIYNALLAQLVEVLDLESRGSRFESEEGHHNNILVAE